jgi:uncharacterized membrane protein YhaH (DUF805 family)
MNWYLKAFNNKFDFSGRASRPEFWVFFIANYVICALLVAVCVGVGLGLLWASKNNGLATLVITLMVAAGVIGVFSLVTLIPTISAAVRRLHDSGRSGKWLLLYVPVLALAIVSVLTKSRELHTVTSIAEFAVNVTMLVFMLLPGSTGENQYGPPTEKD